MSTEERLSDKVAVEPSNQITNLPSDTANVRLGGEVTPIGSSQRNATDSLDRSNTVTGKSHRPSDGPLSEKDSSVPAFSQDRNRANTSSEMFSSLEGMFLLLFEREGVAGAHDLCRQFPDFADVGGLDQLPGKLRAIADELKGLISLSREEDKENESGSSLALEGQAASSQKVGSMP